MEVLLEQIRSDFRVVAEGHDLLARKIVDMERTFGQRFEFLEKAMTDGFGKVWEAIGGVNKRLDGTNSRLDDANHHLGNLTTRFDVHERAHTA